MGENIGPSRPIRREYLQLSEIISSIGASAFVT